MDNKIIRVIKKIWVIPVSILLLFPMTIIGAMIGAVIVEITGIEWIYYVFFGIAGILSSLPIVNMVWKSDILSGSLKIAIIVLLVLLFSMVSYELIWYS